MTVAEIAENSEIKDLEESLILLQSNYAECLEEVKKARLQISTIRQNHQSAEKAAELEELKSDIAYYKDVAKDLKELFKNTLKRRADLLKSLAKMSIN